MGARVQSFRLRNFSVVDRSIVYLALGRVRKTYRGIIYFGTHVLIELKRQFILKVQTAVQVKRNEQK